MNRKRISLAALAIAFAAFLLHIIHSANNGEPLIWFVWVNAIPYGDKIGHFGLFAILTWQLDVGLFRGRHFGWGKQRILLSPMLVSLFALAEELSQIRIRHRTFDLTDLAATLAGIACAAWTLSRRHRLNLKPSDSVEREA